MTPQEELLEILMGNGLQGVVLVDARGLIRRVNPVVTRLTGYQMAELEGRHILRLFPQAEDRLLLDGVAEQVWHDGNWQGEVRFTRKGGDPGSIYVQINGLCSQTESGQQFIVQMTLPAPSRLAQSGGLAPQSTPTDPLTGLPGRLLFEDRLAQAITQAKRHNKSVGLMHLDLDRFKVINDSLGYDRGDQILIEIGQRLAKCLRTSDSVGRIGADEFALLLSDISAEAGAVRNASIVARKVYEFLSDPVVVGNQTVEVSAAMGITLFPQDGTHSADLIKNAETALSHARRKGRNSYQFFSSEMTETAKKRFALENSLREAIHGGQLRLYYQPQVELETGRVIGAEALVRWLHPERGLISPGDFIPVAEETGLIVPMGDWVLRTACEQLASWKALGIPPIRIGVNLSAIQFKRQDLAKKVEDLVRETGIDPQLLDLEITESAIMDDVERAIDILNRISALGIKLSIDDFGTGYSSLSQLRLFPFKTLKIDRSFVLNIGKNPGDAAIVSAIVAMAHSLDQTVIVEGLETKEQLSIMKALRCNEMQGFLFSAPVPAEQLTRMLIEGRHLEDSGSVNDLYPTKGAVTGRDV
ncbi:MAG: EAL domain-containing protein [Magnetococcales bacterium]|nr:EAL domain-containing protein [Magnetococcales bacterium]